MAGGLDRFRPQRRNANRHTQRGLSMLSAAMAQDGYVAPITVAADGETIDGSARLERVADQFAGVEPIVVEHDGTRPVVMVRTDIASAEEPIAKRIALRANRIAEVDLEWDEAVLEELRLELPELSADLFDVPIDMGNERAGEEDNIKEQYLVLAECVSEGEQLRLIEDLQGKGIKCRAMLS